MVNENDFDAHLIWLTSATVSFCLALTVITCVCGCRKRVPKNELLGLAGLVKITNPDENVNFCTGAPNLELNSVSISTHELNSESQDSNKRSHNALATATRSLPDLPVDSGETLEKMWGPTENAVDTNSDLYATVEDAGRKKRLLTSGLTVDSSYTPSQTDDSLSPYARLRGEHPYDQLQQNEHPYAQVSNGSIPGPSTSSEPVPNGTPSSRRGAETNEGDEASRKSPSLDEVPDEIPAASAIAGSVPANSDLPYMTPPLHAQQQQQHFSGDSVDSSKGYTSISVREPLSRILANRRNGNTNGDGSNAGGTAVIDPHYATVSDDSDEMYAAIEERQVSLNIGDVAGFGGCGGEYTSGSETYAQIAQPSSSTNNASNHPPNLSLVLHHQDSVSTCSSDSPRRDRRVANSPLPQVPALDEMYAKVNKKGRSPTTADPPENGIVPRRSSQVVDDEPSSLPGYETVHSSDPNYEELQPSPCGEPDYASLSRRYQPHQSEGAFSDTTSYEPTYETARFRHSTYEPGSLTDPNYESVGSSDEPPYEKVNSVPPEPPDYEIVCSRAGQPLTSVSDLYAKVNKPEKR
ncbi:Hypothetical protein NTJ_05177 [Nesidiocoris tenuis]|uniref:Uncharacterized protein n=1 Tax=Nesidiocoris tenuis TaxID=355587 RepID=A0ABN7AN93_9HEMI|nr:Hypothetical protein NTJ_05177 [Nesidiocoris tenuis]